MNLLLLYLMSFIYFAAGVYHFVNPKMYLRIMPPYIPFHLPLVYITGILEIIIAALLLPEGTRPLGAWIAVVFLIAVFPANIQMAINFWRKKHTGLWIALLRLPLQLLLIYWAWIYTMH